MHIYTTRSTLRYIQYILPRFLVIVEAAVLGDPAVYLDPSGFFVSKKSGEESPRELEGVCRIKQFTPHLLLFIKNTFVW